MSAEPLTPPTRRVFGTIRLIANKWEVETEPHVMIRLKRLFGKVDKAAAGKVRLSNTLENARDLEWLTMRYPMEIFPAGSLEKEADLHRQRTEYIFNLMNGLYTPPRFDLALPARDYQATPAAIVEYSHGLLIGDDVGLGKTLEGICCLLLPHALPALVVTLAHLPRQWANEIARFTPKLKVHILRGTTPYDIANFGKRGENQPGLFATGFPDVIISNYHKLAGWAPALAGQMRTVVFDEVHELRRKESGKYDAALRIASSAVYRVGLTATPIFNYGGEYFNVSEVLRPGALGDWDEFRREWVSSVDSNKPRIRNPKAFGFHLREHGLMIRRTRKEVGRELPPLQNIPHYIAADTQVLERVQDAAYELAKIIVAQGEAFKGQKFQAAEQLNNIIRQETGIAKAPYVADFVKMLLESGEKKILLGGWHRAVYNIWRSRLADFEPVMFTGSESPAQKQESLDSIIEGKSRIAIMSLRSGAGIDGLQKVIRTVVYGELDWSPAVHEQFTGRVYRDGQPDPCCAYYLLSEYGSDPAMTEVLGIKREQSEGIKTPKADDVIERMQTDPNAIRRLAESIIVQKEGRALARGRGDE